jgi:hypothetical protein
MAHLGRKYPYYNPARPAVAGPSWPHFPPTRYAIDPSTFWFGAAFSAGQPNPTRLVPDPWVAGVSTITYRSLVTTYFFLPVWFILRLELRTPFMTYRNWSIEWAGAPCWTSLDSSSADNTTNYAGCLFANFPIGGLATAGPNSLVANFGPNILMNAVLWTDPMPPPRSIPF